MMKSHGKPQGGMDIGVRYGRNLLVGTTDKITQFDATRWGDVFLHQLVRSAPEDFLSVLEKGQTYTLSVFVDNTSSYDVSIRSRTPIPTQEYNDTSSNESISPGESGRLSVTFTIPHDAKHVYLFIVRFPQVIGTVQKVGLKEPKLELGSIPTPWTPAPEDLKTVDEKADHLLKLYYGGY